MDPILVYAGPDRRSLCTELKKKRKSPALAYFSYVYVCLSSLSIFSQTFRDFNAPNPGKQCDIVQLLSLCRLDLHRALTLLTDAQIRDT